MGVEELFIFSHDGTVEAVRQIFTELDTGGTIPLDSVFRFLLPLLPFITAVVFIKVSERLTLKRKIGVKAGGTILLLVYAALNIEAMISEWGFQFSQYDVFILWFFFTWILLFAAIKSSVTTIKLGIKHYKLQGHKSIGVYGTSGAGKTTFIATLAEMIWNGRIRPHWNLEVPQGLAHIRDVIRRLKNGDWPPRTMPGTMETVELKIVDNNGIRTNNHRLYMSDISGEEFEQFIRNPSLENLPETIAHINRCQGFLILIDPDNAPDESYDYHSLIQYLVRVKSLGEKEKLDELFAFVFTKNDVHNISDPERFAQKHMPPFYNAYKIRLRPERTRFFTCSSVGAVDPETNKPKVPMEPVGLDEPVEWIIENLKKVTVREVSRGVVEEIEGQMEEMESAAFEGEAGEEAWGEEEAEETEGAGGWEEASEEESNGQTCPNCGATAGEHAEQCPECGALLPVTDGR